MNNPFDFLTNSLSTNQDTQIPLAPKTKQESLVEALAQKQESLNSVSSIANTSELIPEGKVWTQDDILKKALTERDESLAKAGYNIDNLMQMAQRKPEAPEEYQQTAQSLLSDIRQDVTGRDAGEITQDVSNQLIKSGINLVGLIPAGLSTLIRDERDSSFNAMKELMNIPIEDESVLKRSLEDAALNIQAYASSFESNMTEGTQINKAKVERELANEAFERAKVKEAGLRQSGSWLEDATIIVGEQVVGMLETIDTYIENPLAAQEIIVSNAAQLLAAPVAGKRAGQTYISKVGNEILQTTEGKAALEVMKKTAIDKTGSELTNKQVNSLTSNLRTVLGNNAISNNVALKEGLDAARTSAVLVSTGVLEGAGAKTESLYDMIDSIPHSTWLEDDEYQDLVSKGMPSLDAKRTLVSKYSDRAAFIQGLIAPIVSKLTGSAKVEGQLLSKGNPFTAGKNVITGTAIEVTEEGLQEGSNKVQTNFAVKEIDPSRSVLEGVGQAAGTGMVAAGGTHLGISGGAKGLDILSNIGGKTPTILSSQLEKFNNYRQARKETKEQESFSNQAEEAATVVTGSNKEMDTSADIKNNLDTEEAKSIYEQYNLSDDDSAFEGITKIYNELDNESLDISTRRDLNAAAKSTIDKYQDTYNELIKIKESGEDLSAYNLTEEALDNSINKVETFLNNPITKSIVKNSEGLQITQEEEQEIVTGLKDNTIDEANLPKAINTLRYQLKTNVDGLSDETLDVLIERGTDYNLSEKDMRAVSTARVLRNLGSVSNESLEGVDPFYKGANTYARDIINNIYRGKDITEPLGKFLNFANHMETKAKVFQDTLADLKIQQSKITNTGELAKATEIVNPTTGKPYTRRDSNANMFLTSKSDALVNKVVEDAAKIKDIYLRTEQAALGKEPLESLDELPKYKVELDGTWTFSGTRKRMFPPKGKVEEITNPKEVSEIPDTEENIEVEPRTVNTVQPTVDTPVSVTKTESIEPKQIVTASTPTETVTTKGVTFSRTGGYEVSSKGDKRFSAFNATLSDGRTIEEAYQVDVKGYGSVKEGKGKPPKDTTKDMYKEYLKLWKQWANENPDLIEELRENVSKNGNHLSDRFASTPVNQARALADILNETQDNTTTPTNEVTINETEKENETKIPTETKKNSNKVNSEPSELDSGIPTSIELEELRKSKLTTEEALFDGLSKDWNILETKEDKEDFISNLSKEQRDVLESETRKMFTEEENKNLNKSFDDISGATSEIENKYDQALVDKLNELVNPPERRTKEEVYRQEPTKVPNNQSIFNNIVRTTAPSERFKNPLQKAKSAINKVATFFVPKKLDSVFNNIPNFSDTVGKSLEDNSINELFEPLLGRPLSENEITYLNETVKLSNKLKEEFNTRLQAKNKDGKSFHDGSERLFFGTIPLLQFAVTNPITKQIEIAPHVVDAIALGTMKHFQRASSPEVNEAKRIAGILGYANTSFVTTEDLVKYKGVIDSYSNTALTVGRDVFNSLGLKKNKNITPEDGLLGGNTENAIYTALGSEVIALLNREGITDSATVYKEGKTLLYVKLNTENDNFKNLKEVVSKSSDLASVLTSVEDTPSLTINEPIKNTVKTVKGNKQSISNLILKSINAQQNTPIKLNPKLFSMYVGMATNANPAVRELLKTMLGYTDTSRMIDSMRIRQESINEGIERSINNLIALDELINDKGSDVAEAEIFLKYYTINNGRTMIDGQIGNMQADKIVRELMTPVVSELDLNNPTDIRNFKLVTAQGLGIDTENSHHDDAIVKLEALLKEEPIVNIINELRSTSELDGTLPDSLNNVVTTMFSKNPTGAVRALSEYADYLNAKAKGDTKFTSYATYDIDGKTNGVANMLMSVGLGALRLTGASDSFIQNLLEKIGVYVNDKDKTYADVKAQPGFKDIYEQVGKAFSKLLTEAYNKPGSLINSDTKAAIEYFIDDLSINEITTEDGVVYVDVNTKRNFTKLAVTQIIYGALQPAIEKLVLSNTVKSIEAAYNKIYEDSLSDNPDISNPESIAQRLEEFNNNFRILTGRSAGSKLNKSFKVNDKDADRLSLLTHGDLSIGSMLYNAVTTNEMLSSTLAVTSLITMVTKQQYEFYNKMVNIDTEIRLNQLRTEGKLLPNETLPLEEAEAIANRHKHLAPIYTATSMTKPDMANTEEYGINLLDRGNEIDESFLVNSLGLNSKGKQVTGYTYKETAKAPGVRFLSMGIQNKEATMMAYAQVVAHNKGIGFFNNYDGARLPVKHMNELSTLLNKGVAASWTQSDYLGNAINDIKNSLFEPNTMKRKAVEDLNGKKHYHTFRFNDRTIMQRLPTELLNIMYANGSRDTVYNILHLLNNVRHQQSLLNNTLFHNPDVSTTVNQMVGDKSFIASNLPKVKTTEQKILDAKESKERGYLRNLDTLVKGENGLKSIKTKDVSKLFDTPDALLRNVIKKVTPMIDGDKLIYIGSREDIVNHLTKEFGDTIDISNIDNANAVVFDHVYLIDSGNGVFSDSVAHELIHEALGNVIDTYMNQETRDTLTKGQQGAVRNLVKLMNEYMTGDNSKVNGEPTYLASILNTLSTESEKVNEFIAYALTTKKIAEELAQKESKDGFFKNLGNKVMYLINKIFGFTNTSESSFFSQTYASFNELTKSKVKVNTNSSDPILRRQQTVDDINDMEMGDVYDSLPEINDSVHNAQLKTWVNYIQRNLINKLKKDKNTPNIDNFEDLTLYLKLTGQADTIAQSFINSGWNMSEREALAFKLLQVSSQIGLDIGYIKSIEAKRLYYIAKRSITPDMLSTDATVGQMKWDALFGDSSQSDSQGKSDRISKFIALANTSKEFGKVLNSLPTVDTSLSSDGTVVGKLKNIANYILSQLSGLASKSGRSPIMDKRLNQLALALNGFEAESKEFILDKFTRKTEAFFRPLNEKVTDYSESAGQAISSFGAKLQAKNNLFTPITIATRATGSVLSKTVSKATGKSIKKVINRASTPETPLNPALEAINEMLGTNEDNAKLHNLIDKANTNDRIREANKEALSELLTEQFGSLSETEELLITKTILGTDMEVLIKNGYNVVELLSNRGSISRAIDNVKASIDTKTQGIPNGANIAAFYKIQAEGLGLMFHSGNSNLDFQLRNISAIAEVRLPEYLGINYTVDSNIASQVESDINNLAALSALYMLKSQEAVDTINLIEREKAGIELLIAYHRDVKKQESNKQGSKYMVQAGYVPENNDPNLDVKYLTDKEVLDFGAMKLLNMGYTKVGKVDKFNIYKSKIPPQTSWVSGAMFTGNATITGINAITGTNGLGSNLNVKGKEAEALIRKQKSNIMDMFNPANVGSYNRFTAPESKYQPVFDSQGNVITMSLTLSKELKQNLYNSHNSFADVLSMWKGRIDEEIDGKELNRVIAKKVGEQFRKDVQANKAVEYITVSADSKNKRVREVYNMMPHDMKVALFTEFKTLKTDEYGNVSGSFEIRKDVFYNTFGFREMSIRDVFNEENTNLFQKIVRDILTGLMGESAYRKSVKSEMYWKEFVSMNKNFILVKSGVVAIFNILSNMGHALVNGVPLGEMLKNSAAGIKYQQEYLKNERDLNKLKYVLQINPNNKNASNIKARISEIEDEQARNPARLLIEEGLVSNISSDSSLGQDRFSETGKISKKLKEMSKDLPEKVKTVGKEAGIVKGSQAYKVFDALMQSGDFVAKFVMYQHLTNRQFDKLTSDQALARVKDEFVNYNILSSPLRHYLEQSGFTWFLSYKLRMQKVLLRTFQEHPIKSMAAIAGMTVLPTPFAAMFLMTYLGYNIGIGNALNGFGMHPALLFAGMGLGLIF